MRHLQTLIQFHKDGPLGFGARLAEGLVIRVIRFPGRYKKPRAYLTMDSLPRNAELRSLTKRTALADQCLHSAEADVRPPRRKSGFDPNPTFGAHSSRIHFSTIQDCPKHCHVLLASVASLTTVRRFRRT